MSALSPEDWTRLLRAMSAYVQAMENPALNGTRGAEADAARKLRTKLGALQPREAPAVPTDDELRAIMETL